MTAKEFIDKRGKELVHTVSWVEMVSPHRPVSLADVPLFKAVLGRRFEDEREEVPRR